ncbi:hypothetical protein [Nonomuraea dietziae]|uniref:hypothetical protein n=1 Tax=Nonomuraea dietziae TaxID=65515 RepID=UPI00344002F2
MSRTLLTLAAAGLVTAVMGATAVTAMGRPHQPCSELVSNGVNLLDLNELAASAPGHVVTEAILCLSGSA